MLITAFLLLPVIQKLRIASVQYIICYCILSFKTSDVNWKLVLALSYHSLSIGDCYDRNIIRQISNIWTRNFPKLIATNNYLQKFLRYYITSDYTSSFFLPSDIRSANKYSSSSPIICPGWLFVPRFFISLYWKNSYFSVSAISSRTDEYLYFFTFVNILRTVLQMLSRRVISVSLHHRHRKGQKTTTHDTITDLERQDTSITE